MNGKKLVQAVVEIRRDDEKQLPHREFIEMQIRATHDVRIQHRVDKAIASAGKFTSLAEAAICSCAPVE